jgi:hypothetical protein
VITRLREAARIVADAMLELDTRAEKCEGCGHKRYKNFDQKVYHDHLSGALTRLNKVADEMERKQEDGS